MLSVLDSCCSNFGNSEFGNLFYLKTPSVGKEPEFVLDYDYSGIKYVAALVKCARCNSIFPLVAPAEPQQQRAKNSSSALF